MLGLTHDPLAGSATSLRDHGILERPERRAVLSVVGSGADAESTYAGDYFNSAFQAGVAAVEAVVGRVVRMMTTARVEVAGAGRNPLAPRLLTLPVLMMIARDLMERGESLRLLAPTREIPTKSGRPMLLPTDYGWTVVGGADPSTWIIRSEVTGALGVRASVDLPRDAYLHIVRDPSPSDPSRGVPALQRASITAMAMRVMEDALLREGRQPSAALIPMPDLGEQGESVATDLRAKIENPRMTLALPPTTQGGFGSGGTGRPQTDWKPYRLKVEPTQELVEATAQLQARAVSALGAHPAILGGAGATGTVDREARRQLMEGLVIPLGAHVAYEASSLLQEEVRLTWPENPDTALAMARTEHVKAQTEKLKREPAEPPPTGAGG